MAKKVVNKKYMRYIFLLFCLLITIAFMFSFIKTDKSVLKPVNGVIDLQNWRADSDGVLRLNGQWNFYWERLLSYQEVIGNPNPNLKVNIPSAWNSYKIGGKSLSGFGYGTYTLKVVNAEVGRSMALRIPALSTAYEVYIDDDLAASSGNVGKDKEQFSPESKSQEVVFTPNKKSFEIIVHVANFTYFQGGMIYPIKLGTSEQIHDMGKSIADLDLFLFGALAIMAFYYISTFLLQRDDKSNLLLGLICIVWASKTAISGDYLIYRLIPSASFETVIAIYYLILCWYSICACVMIVVLFQEEQVKKILRVAYMYAVIMSLIVLLTPVSFYSRLYYIIETVGILISLCCLYTIVMAFLRGKKDAWILLVGLMALNVCTVHEVMYQSKAGQLGTLIILIVQTFVLAKRFSESFRDVSQLSQKLLRLDKIKDEFLANTSHELRTPLSGILGITEAMLKGSEGELNSRQQQNLITIAGSSRRLANLVNDLLDYSKMKNGDINIYTRSMQVEGLIYTVVNVFKQLSQSENFEIISEIPEGLPPVIADENRVVQVLYNLLGNAVKFTDIGSVKISARKTGGMLEICVSDTGEGIPEDKFEDIFKSFEQVDNSLTRRYGGTGLGLAITKQLVELQGGSIWVKSMLGLGSQFYFTLPLAKAVTEENMPYIPAIELTAAYREEVTLPEASREGDTHILLVDDDEVNLQAATAILKLEGYGITAVRSGQAGLDFLKKCSDCSLVILDVMMPGMSGYEFCSRLREDKSNLELPVLMLTARASIKDIVLGFEVGANDYLPKPFESEELLARVRTLAHMKASVDRAVAAEVAFLQAQIKPHFLFNTLNTISSFCDTNPELAQQLIDNFSGYLRETFDFKNLEMYQPIEKELSLINSFIEIEKARFGEELKVVVAVDPSITVKIPFFSIQPLVENAISHGLRKKGGEGTVTVTVKKVLAGILVAVEDDGQGIPLDRLEVLLKPEAGRGIGLWNIDKRLKKLYGKGLTIESVLGKGTCVSYIVPLEVTQND